MVGGEEREVQSFLRLRRVCEVVAASISGLYRRTTVLSIAITFASKATTEHTGGVVSPPNTEVISGQFLSHSLPPLNPGLASLPSTRIELQIMFPPD